MMKNNLYNFRNQIRHFINIDGIEIHKDVDRIDIKDLAWSVPISFRLKKESTNYRLLKIPNILNFLCALHIFKEYCNFLELNKIDSRKRLVPNLDTGDFKAGIFDKQVEDDLVKLCMFDNLIRLDIKSYYERIYMHDIVFDQSIDERFYTGLNEGNTNGLIMGNYISTFLAEKHLKKISDEIQRRLIDKAVSCEFSYFSDDFYFFCNKKDNNIVLDVFEKTLEIFNLERKDEIEIWDYMKYNEYNIIEKYWRKIINECEERYDSGREDNFLYFTNQIIYKMSKLEDLKSKKIFINEFFKSRYFRELEINKFKIEQYNFHQICYLYKICPEALIYSIDKFKVVEYFEGEVFRKFLAIRYKESLSKSFNEEQLYYFYALRMLNHEEALKSVSNLVVKTNNQILISYYLMLNFFKTEEKLNLKEMKDEKFWFQNYHLIMYSDLKNNIEKSINEYLIPKMAKRDRQKENYLEFYKINMEKGRVFITDLDEMESRLKEYVDLKILEKRNLGD